MELYLIRHAVAFERDHERWPNDAKRPLTLRGEEAFGAVAHELGRIVPEVEVLLSSPYTRAWRTAEILASRTSWPAPGVLAALEPDTPLHKVTAALETYKKLDSVALVGHRPSLHELISYLLTGSGEAMNVGLKKGGAACLRFTDAPEPGVGKLRWLLTPTVLRAR